MGMDAPDFQAVASRVHQHRGRLLCTVRSPSVSAVLYGVVAARFSPFSGSLAAPVQENPRVWHTTEWDDILDLLPQCSVAAIDS